MKRIAFLPVGGTICTALRNEGDLAVHEAAAFWLTEEFQKSDSPFAGKVVFSTADNLKILSENMTVAQWNRIHHAYTSLPLADCDGVIVAHGTDTLAYSAALFSLLWSDTRCPVILVAANRPLASPYSNGHRNFRAAVESICLGLVPGVYVCYENPSDGTMYLHLASRLEQCRSYSEDFFSRGMSPLPEELSQRREAVEGFGRRFPQKAGRAFPKEGKLQPCVSLLTPYVGLSYSDVFLDSCKAVLHLAYHSGTVCVGEGGSNSILALLERCARAGVDCYLCPSRKEGELYESVSTLCRHGKAPCFLYGTTVESAYAKLLLAYSLLPPEQRQDFLQKDIHYEFFSEN